MITILTRGALGLFWAIALFCTYILLLTSTAILTVLGLVAVAVFGAVLGLIKFTRRGYVEVKRRASGS